MGGRALRSPSFEERRQSAIRILVVEDEPDVADLIRDALRAAGHDCVVAPDASAAEQVLLSSAVDGITLDVRIPGRDGLDWLGGLFAARPSLARRTIVVTGTDLSPADCSRLARCGASMLAKPFRMEELLSTVSKQLAPLHHEPDALD